MAAIARSPIAHRRGAHGSALPHVARAVVGIHPVRAIVHHLLRSVPASMQQDVPTGAMFQFSAAASELQGEPASVTPDFSAEAPGRPATSPCERIPCIW